MYQESGNTIIVLSIANLYKLHDVFIKLGMLGNAIGSVCFWKDEFQESFDFLHGAHQNSCKLILYWGKEIN